ncbi:hypothetical protein JMJ77_0001832 [Colletotrichum scovillei]|uniref:Uncharacterized protein n=1 Tax=Colletotrichum scovillei TaxID=1209932 RepID=A0A9P7R9L1_9PEZI|nr:hypothetical protein JMJ77_0001832 [Colletotrichum scovillei]KAG7070242.1 hypothetical protein JMJ76_0001498 [Colletotrichum scovillei]KAG7078494.1 hypothetical protein JMJ78_0002165 [Colletotrichum scovillei]
MASHHTGREWTEMKSLDEECSVSEAHDTFHQRLASNGCRSPRPGAVAVRACLWQLAGKASYFLSESTSTFLRHFNLLDKPADPSAATVTDITAQGLGPAFQPSADGNSVTSEKGALCILSGAQHEPLDEMTSRTYPVPFVAKSTLVEKGSISDVPLVESHVVAQAFDDDPTTFFTH